MSVCSTSYKPTYSHQFHNYVTVLMSLLTVTSSIIMSVCSYEPTYSHQFHNYVRLFLIVISFSCHCSCSHQFPGVRPFLLSPVPHDMSLKTNKQIKTSKQTNKSTNVPCLCQSSTVHGCSLGLTHNRGELRSQHLLICIPNPPAFPLGGQQFKKEEKEKKKKKRSTYRPYVLYYHYNLYPQQSTACRPYCRHHNTLLSSICE